jgi:hypothetical protein
MLSICFILSVLSGISEKGVSTSPFGGWQVAAECPAD